MNDNEMVRRVLGRPRKYEARKKTDRIQLLVNKWEYERLLMLKEAMKARSESDTIRLSLKVTEAVMNAVEGNSTVTIVFNGKEIKIQLF